MAGTSLVRTEDDLREAAYGFVINLWRAHEQAISFSSVSAQLNRRATSLGLNLRAIVEGDERYMIRFKPKGGMLLIPQDAVPRDIDPNEFSYWLEGAGVPLY